MKRVLLFLALLAPCAALCDEWTMPPSVRFSQDKSLMLSTKRIGRRITLTLKRRSIHGWVVQWTTPSPQDREPYEVYFSPRGGVVLQDEWGRLGHGVVLAFISPKGVTLKTYPLKDILHESDVLRSQTSVSSIWWTHGGRIGPRKNGTEFALVTAGRTYQCFDLQTGQMKPMTPVLRESIRQDYIPGARAGLASPDSQSRAEAADLAWVLEDRAAIPTLRKLLDDPSFTKMTHLQARVFPDGTYKEYFVQLAAARSLVQFDPRPMVPVIKSRIRSSNPAMAYDWIETLAEARNPEAQAAMKRLTTDRNPRIARAAKLFLR